MGAAWDNTWAQGQDPHSGPLFEEHMLHTYIQLIRKHIAIHYFYEGNAECIVNTKENNEPMLGRMQSVNDCCTKHHHY